MTLNTSDDIELVSAALVSAIPEIGGIFRDKEGKIAGAKASYTFKYADLRQVLAVTKPALASHGLALLQPSSPHEGGALVRTVVIHSSGQWISDDGVFIPAARRDDPKAYGSAVSYARRYGACSMFGISQADDDAEGAGAKPKQKKVGSDSPSVKLATKGVRDALVARISALPLEYSEQIGSRLRGEQVVWTKLDVDMANTVTEWVGVCEELAKNEGEKA